MKQLLLAIALIAVPVAAFTAFTLYQSSHSSAAASSASLGDLSAFQSIIADVQTIVGAGDLAAAETRITDFETAWDEAEGTLRPLNTNSWGNVDDAADAALGALRSRTPKLDQVNATLILLMAELDNPALGSGGAPVAPAIVSGITITDESGRPLPCEDMLAILRTAMASAKLSDADRAGAEAFQAKATERCNADDDQHADEFSAKALALAGQ